MHVLHGIGVQLATGGQAGFAAGIETGAIEVQVAARLELDVLGVDARRGGLQALFGVLVGGGLLAQPVATFLDRERVLRSGIGGGRESEGFPRNEGGFAGGDERGGFEGEVAASQVDGLAAQPIARAFIAAA